jgi:hypothetical protein
VSALAMIEQPKRFNIATGFAQIARVFHSRVQ